MFIETEKDRIEIPFSKNKIILLTCGAILFIVIGFWLWLSADSQTLYNPVVVRLIAFNCFVFFCICGFIGFRKLFDKNPGLLIDHIGITDNSSAIGGHVIKWSEITDVQIQEVKRTKFLLIYVKNPQDYINKSNIFKRFWMRLNHGVYGTPLSITSTALEWNISELLEVISKARGKYSA